VAGTQLPTTSLKACPAAPHSLWGPHQAFSAPGLLLPLEPAELLLDPTQGAPGAGPAHSGSSKTCLAAGWPAGPAASGPPLDQQAATQQLALGNSLDLIPATQASQPVPCEGTAGGAPAAEGTAGGAPAEDPPAEGTGGGPAPAHCSAPLPHAPHGSPLGGGLSDPGLAAAERQPSLPAEQVAAGRAVAAGPACGAAPPCAAGPVALSRVRLQGMRPWALMGSPCGRLLLGAALLQPGAGPQVRAPGWGVQGF
jgi:hypothetical protein